MTVPVLDWADHLCLALDEIRLWGGGSLQIHMRIRAMLDDLGSTVDASHQAAIEEQRALLHETAEQHLAEHERDHLDRRVGGVG